jgi:hypothetical protein
MTTGNTRGYLGESNGAHLSQYLKESDVQETGRAVVIIVAPLRDGGNEDVEVQVHDLRVVVDLVGEGRQDLGEVHRRQDERRGVCGEECQLVGGGVSPDLSVGLLSLEQEPLQKGELPSLGAEAWDGDAACSRVVCEASESGAQGQRRQ